MRRCAWYTCGPIPTFARKSCSRRWRGSLPGLSGCRRSDLRMGRTRRHKPAPIPTEVARAGSVSLATVSKAPRPHASRLHRLLADDFAGSSALVALVALVAHRTGPGHRRIVCLRHAWGRCTTPSGRDPPVTAVSVPTRLMAETASRLLLGCWGRLYPDALSAGRRSWRSPRERHTREPPPRRAQSAAGRLIRLCDSWLDGSGSSRMRVSSGFGGGS